MVTNNFYVYKHTCPNGKVYIGITCKKPHLRWDNGNGYRNNEHFFRAIVKYGWDNIQHDVLFSGLSKDEACRKEIELIAKYMSYDYEKGYNNTFGGEHGLLTEETKQKIKANHANFKGENNPNFGKKRSQEVIAKNAGKNNSRSKRVAQYLPTGELVGCYWSGKEAEKETGVLQSGVSNCASGKIKSSGGFVWRYVSDEVPNRIEAVDISRKGSNNSFFGKKHSDATKEKFQKAWGKRKMNNKLSSE